MNREAFVKQLQPVLRRCSAWRTKQAVRFPNDHRNPIAAVTLEKLARFAPDSISDDIWADMQGVIASEYESPRWHEAIAEACRAVHFQFWPKDLNDFLDQLMSRLTIPSGQRVCGAL